MTRWGNPVEIDRRALEDAQAQLSAVCKLLDSERQKHIEYKSKLKDALVVLKEDLFGERIGVDRAFGKFTETIDIPGTSPSYESLLKSLNFRIKELRGKVVGRESHFVNLRDKYEDEVTSSIFEPIIKELSNVVEDIDDILHRRVR